MDIDIIINMDIIIDGLSRLTRAFQRMFLNMYDNRQKTRNE